MTMKRILTGDRPTGRLHIGHYVGSLSNRVKLQHDYDTFIEIADIQALTTHFERPELISDSIMQVAIDNLSVGLDPEKVTLFLQSQIPSIAELTIFYSMFVTMNTLRHNPTVKTEAAQYGYDDMTYGFIGYPVSQAADITFCNADLVPVGEDQKPHIELARKLVRLRVFRDDAGKMNRSILEAGGEILLVSQFSLAGKLGKGHGNRPDFGGAEDPARAKELYERVIAKVREEGVTVATGVFGAHMFIEQEQDGPLTFIFEC